MAKAMAHNRSMQPEVTLADIICDFGETIKATTKIVQPVGSPDAPHNVPPYGIDAMSARAGIIQIAAETRGS